MGTGGNGVDVSKKPSLYPTDDGCFLCHSPYTECHHIYPSSRRPISEREGCTVRLCHEHHQGLTGVHNNHELQEFFRADCQRRWEEREGIDEPDHESFIRLFYRSYL